MVIEMIIFIAIKKSLFLITFLVTNAREYLCYITIITRHNKILYVINTTINQN